MKRPVAALPMPDVQPGAPPTPRPEITWIAPSDLLIDATYQRDLSDASVRLIRRIVENWDWRRLKPPIAAWTDEGLEVIDGQHTAIAAASHPGIETIPVVVVEAVAQVDRAQAFLGHNRDRLGITAAQMHHAALAAGDETALSVERVCLAADVTVLRLPPARGVYKARTTIAVSAVRTLVAADTAAGATWVLRTLADAGLAPIAAAHIQALRHLATAEEFAEVDTETLARAIGTTPIKLAEKDAREHAATHCVPAWRGLAAVWFKAAKRLPRRKAELVVEPAEPLPSPEKAIPDPPPDPARRRHAELVEAARRAVPAPTFSRPGGASVRTG